MESLISIFMPISLYQILAFNLNILYKKTKSFIALSLLVTNNSLIYFSIHSF